MSDIIKKQLLESNSNKVKIRLENDYVYFGYVKEVDDNYVTLQLDKSNYKITVKLSTIVGVLVYESNN
jgi:transcription elongation factor